MLCTGSFSSKVRGKRLGIKDGEQFQQNWVSNQFMQTYSSIIINSLQAPTGAWVRDLETTVKDLNEQVGQAWILSKVSEILHF